MENIVTNSFHSDSLVAADIISCDNCGQNEVMSETSLALSESSKMNVTPDSCDLINKERNASSVDEAVIHTENKNRPETNSRLCEHGGSSNERESFCEEEEEAPSASDKNQTTIESEEIIFSNETTFAEVTAEERLTAGESEEEIRKESEAGFCYEWDEAPILLCSATEEYQPTPLCENFTKGCQWSPDGTCLLAASEDFRIRVYELPGELYSGKVSSEIILPPLKAALCVKEGGVVYDSCWFPMMNSWDPSTCCFASTSKESPVHLWDAFTGELRATYRAYNQVDEVEAAISVQFINSGAEVWSGFKGALRTFDTGRPGRQVNTISLKKDIPNVTGIVSCIRENPAMPGLVAFGTYSKTIGLYKDGPLCALKTASGVTQIEFSPCGMKLYSAVRRNNEMLCWDLRNPGTVLYSIQGRQADTNQRIQFSISPDGNDLVSGGTDGCVSVWQQDQNIVCEENLEMKQKIKLSVDCVNGVSLHRSLPIMASSTGQRICEEEAQRRDNSVRFWWCGPKR